MLTHAAAQAHALDYLILYRVREFYKALGRDASPAPHTLSAADLPSQRHSNDLLWLTTLPPLKKAIVRPQADSTRLPSPIK